VPRELDALEKSLSCLGTKALQLSEPSVDCGSLEVIERFNAELLVDEIDLGAAESGNAEEIEQSTGCLFAQAIEIGGLAGLDQILHDGECRGSNTFGLLQLSGFEERRQVIGTEGENSPGSLLVSAGVEAWGAAEVEQSSDLGKHMRG
jgi:hypothetical protein